MEQRLTRPVIPSVLWSAVFFRIKESMMALFTLSGTLKKNTKNVDTEDDGRLQTLEKLQMTLSYKTATVKLCLNMKSESVFFPKDGV